MKPGKECALEHSGTIQRAAEIFFPDVKIHVSMLQVAQWINTAYLIRVPSLSDAPGISESADIVIVEVNEKMPVVHGIRMLCIFHN
jgi:acyl-CoA hydrolase